MKRSNRSGLFCLVLAAACALPASAQLRGEYSPGSYISGAGSVPDPGFSYSNQFWYNTADRLYGPKGKLKNDDDDYFALTDNNSFTFVPNAKLWGAKLEFMVDLAISSSRFVTIDASVAKKKADDATPAPLVKAPVEVGAVGISDTNFVPFDLGWSFPRLDLQAGLSVYATTGRYQPGAEDNLASGFWSVGPQVGATIYLTKNKSNQVSLYTYYAWNTHQQRTQNIPGQDVSFDYSLSHTFTFGKDGKWSVLAGPAGYGQWQTTANQRPDSLGNRYTIDGIGFTTNFTTPYKGIYIGTSQLWEYNAKATYEGRTSVITGGVNF